MLDSHTLQKGGSYKDLPNLYIIFILEHDIFERGSPVYNVKKLLDITDSEGNNLPFDDDCNIMYVNGEYKGDDALGRLMHDFSTSNADEMFYNELADRMRFLKQDEEGVRMASKIVEEYGDIRAAATRIKITYFTFGIAGRWLPPAPLPFQTFFFAMGVTERNGRAGNRRSCRGCPGS